MTTLSYGDLDGAPGVGRLLDQTYCLKEAVGEGSMGVVYQASHRRLPGRFAVKMLKQRLANNEEALSRFRREAEIMGGLHHPNIVRIIDFNRDGGGRPYLVMEYLEGETLAAALGSGICLPLRRVLSIVGQIAAALDFAHKRGVVHLDVKPANVFLVKFDGQTDDLVKVLDFGISQLGLSADQGASGLGILGTPQYMAPEQALGRSNLDGRVDQFSLAAVAYVMLTGRAAFTGPCLAALMDRLLHRPPRPIPWLLTGNAARIEEVLFRALSKEPGQRFDSAGAFARALSDAAGAPLDAGPARGPAPPPRCQSVSGRLRASMPIGEPGWSTRRPPRIAPGASIPLGSLPG